MEKTDFLFKVKNGRQIAPNLTIEKLCQAKWPIFGRFLWFSLIFEHFPYFWLEISGNDDYDATLSKSLGGTSNRTDFCDSGGKVV